MNVPFVENMSEPQVVALANDVCDWELNGKINTVQTPVLCLLGGQPASGKTLIAEKMYQQLGAEQTVLVDVNDYSRYHPKYSEWLQQNDVGIIEKSSALSHYLAENIKKKSQELGLNVIIKDTLSDVFLSVNSAINFADCGYQVEAHVAAVTGERSMVGLFKRYEARKVINGYSLFIQPEAHDKAYLNLTENADSLFCNVSKFCIYNHRSEIIYKNERKSPSLNWDSFLANPSTIIAIERGRPLSNHEKVEIANDWALIVALQKARGNENSFCQFQLDRAKKEYLGVTSIQSNTLAV